MSSMPHEYWEKKRFDLEDAMLIRNKNSRCAACNVKTSYLFDYKIPESDFTTKICGACKNRYDEMDKWNVFFRN